MMLATRIDLNRALDEIVSRVPSAKRAEIAPFVGKIRDIVPAQDGRLKRSKVANLKISQTAATRRESEIFIVRRVDDHLEVQIVGWLGLTRALSLSEASIRMRFSRFDNEFITSLPGYIEIAVKRTCRLAEAPGGPKEADKIKALRAA